MKMSKHSRLKFRILLGTGALIALVLCVQCVRTYLYADAVLVPQQAEREAERQVGALTTAVRSAEISDPRALGPVIERVLDSESDRVLWMRVLDPENHVLAQGGHAYGTTKIPGRWWESMERHETLAIPVSTPQGKAFVAMLPFRIQRPPRFSETGTRPPNAGPGDPTAQTHSGSIEFRGRPPGDRRPPYVLELGISYQAVANAFEELRQNLIVGLIASIALLISVAVIGLRAPHYIRGKYLESEMQLARRVQSDLQPKPHSFSSRVEFAAAAVAADHVGGDFYDIFEADAGKIVIVLGDVSGKGVSAALLVSVLQGAIRSSTITQHEFACERINRMLCERTAGERFATLFWGVFDPATSTLRYVNAGHAAPLLIRSRQNLAGDEPVLLEEAQTQIIRLDEGGPVLGLLPAARYSAGTIKIEPADLLSLYSDGISEATNQNEEEFGEDRIQRLFSEDIAARPADLCQRVMNQVTAFASREFPGDDRTLLVVRFPHCGRAQCSPQSEAISISAVA